MKDPEFRAEYEREMDAMTFGAVEDIAWHRVLRLPGVYLAASFRPFNLYLVIGQQPYFLRDPAA
jgi:hypothetical protein